MATVGNSVATFSKDYYNVNGQTYGWGGYTTYPSTYYYSYPTTYWVDNKPNLKPCIQSILDNEDLKNKEKIILIEALLKAV